MPLHPAPVASRLGFPPSIAVPGARRHGPSWTEAAFAASCRSTPYTTIPLGLLMGRTGASDISLEEVGQITHSVIRKMGQSCQAPGGAGLVKSLVSCGFFDRESLSASLIPLGCFVPLVSILCHRRLRNAKPRSGQTAPDSQAAFLSLRYSLALKISATPGVDEYKTRKGNMSGPLRGVFLTPGTPAPRKLVTSRRGNGNAYHQSHISIHTASSHYLPGGAPCLTPPSTTAVSPTTIGSCAPCCWMRKAGSCSPTWYGCWAVTWAVGRRRRCVTRRRGRWRRRNSASACSPSAMRWSGIWTPISGGSPGSMTNATGHARTAWSASPGSTLCSGSQRLARHGVCAVGSAARCCHACAASPAPTPRPSAPCCTGKPPRSTPCTGKARLGSPSATAPNSSTAHAR